MSFLYELRCNSKPPEYRTGFTEYMAQLSRSRRYTRAITVTRTLIDFAPMNRFRDLFFFLFAIISYCLSSHDFCSSYKYLWSSSHDPLSGHVRAFVGTPHWSIVGLGMINVMLPHVFPSPSFCVLKSHLLPFVVPKKSMLLEQCPRFLLRNLGMTKSPVRLDRKIAKLASCLLKRYALWMFRRGWELPWLRRWPCVIQCCKYRRLFPRILCFIG